MTREKRREIYEKVLWCIGDGLIIVDEESQSAGVCLLLWYAWKNERPIDWYTDQIKEQFPEFTAQKPKDARAYYWKFTPGGNAQRRLALEKAIALTYAAASPSIHVKKEDNETDKI